MLLKQIRASALSGECSLLHEALRGHLQITKGHQDCVRRRATKSVEANSYCKVSHAPPLGGIFSHACMTCCQGSAKAIVDSVFLRCYSDQAPFDPPSI